MNVYRSNPVTKKILLIMKLTFLFTVVAVFCVNASSYAQKVRLDLNFQNKQIKEILNEIEDQTDFYFMYDNNDVNVLQKVNLKTESSKIEEVLDLLFKGTNIKFKINDRHILLLSNETELLQSQISVSGKVSDSSGSPLPGVTVVVKGTTQGTITDADGNYSLSKVPGDATLTFSFVGMKTQEIPVAGKTTINVAMAEETIGIEEVVAVGYGTIRKSDLTGSVSRVTVEDVSEKSITSVEQMLQGRSAGVQITSNTGAPGGGINFSIRGAASITGSNQPLFVVDGYPLSSDIDAKESLGVDSDIASTPGDNLLSFINPADIESVEILKDASSTAIYGSRASNGVVLITTKRGKSGWDNITYNFRTDVSQLPKTIDVLNTDDYLSYVNEAYLNSGQEAPFDATELAYYSETNTNWQDLIFRTAYSQDHQLNLSGGLEKMRYSVNFGYLNENGIVKNTKFDRGTMAIKFDRELNKKLSFGVNLHTAISKGKAVMQSMKRADVGHSIVSGALRTRPIDAPYTEQNVLDESYFNPLTMVEKMDDINRINTFVSNAFIKYNITNSLSYKFNGGFNTTFTHRDLYYPKGTRTGQAANGYAYYGENSRSSYLIENTLTFNKSFDKHRINAVVGQTWHEWLSKRTGLVVTDFANENLGYYSLQSGTSSTPTTQTSKWALASFIFRTNYSFDNRYLITFTGRADGSTRLGEGNKWDIFPSFGLGWNLHNENFIKPVSFISMCKLRGKLWIHRESIYWCWRYKSSFKFRICRYKSI